MISFGSYDSSIKAKKVGFFLLALLLINEPILSQNLSFSDQELKRFLANENCVDTTNHGLGFSNDIDVDLNNDGEIQLYEAEHIEFLEVKDFQNLYDILSIQDLNQFPNLKLLKLISLDKIVRIKNLQLDSLDALWISDGALLKHVDISNLPGITKTLRIEGITTLDTLNIQNGTSASQFSLFYSFDIKYACIDSIDSEINEFITAGSMLPGVEPSFHCGVNPNETPVFQSSDVNLFPNPSSEEIWIKVDGQEDFEVFISNSKGQLIFEANEGPVDIENLAPGPYILQCKFQNRVIIKRFNKF